MSQIKEQDIIKGQIVLLGDCVIENLHIDKYFKDYQMYNNGISGDTTVQLMETLYKRAIKYKPSKLFLSIGSNDIGFDNRDIKQIYNNIIEIVEELKKRTKDTEIYVMSILPVNASLLEYINREYVDARDNFDINMLNYYLKNYARKSKIKFLDTRKLLKNNYDMLDLVYTIDGFHLNEIGMNKVSELIKEYV